MGVVYLAGVGTSPGAVTTALAYLKRERPVEVAGDIVEELILFTSPEIRSGQVSILESEYKWNRYGTTTLTQRKERRMSNVLSVIWEFLQKEEILPSWGKLYVWAMDTDDFNSCFEAVAKVVTAKGDPLGTGKHLWANLTGGTNVLNSAIFEAAIFSGLIARLYYTFIPKEYEPYLQPVAKNRPDLFDFQWVPLFKVTFDDVYYDILRIFHEANDWLEERELLSRLKRRRAQKGLELSLAIHQLRTQYLNHMDGRELERRLSENRLSDFGHEMLKRLDEPLYRALVKREERPFSELIEECRRELEEKRWRV